MAEILVLTEAQVRELIEPAELIDAMRTALLAISAGAVSAPPRIAAVLPDGLLSAMPAYVPGVAAEVKVTSVFPDNLKRGLSSHQGLVVVFDKATGTPVAVMDGTAITEMRTAATAALATMLLARTDAKVLTIIGAGVQGRAHLRALPVARGFSDIIIASRNPDNARELAELHPAATPVESIDAAVHDGDVVCLCTDAREPVIRWPWIRAGAHISSVGGSFGSEVDEETLRNARVFVEWPGAVTSAPPAGAHELQEIPLSGVTVLGDVLSGRKDGRNAADEVTLYKSTGHGAEDAVSARLVYEKALCCGVGRMVSI